MSEKELSGAEPSESQEQSTAPGKQQSKGPAAGSTKRGGKRSPLSLFMKHEAFILLFIGLFFGVTCIVYFFWNRTTPAGHYDMSGSVMLFLAACLGLLPGGYMFYWSRRARPRNEDRDAELAEGAGVVDVFPGSSIWPAVAGAGATAICIGLIFGLWVTVMGLFLMLSAFVGFIAESRRGGVY